MSGIFTLTPWCCKKPLYRTQRIFWTLPVQWKIKGEVTFAGIARIVKQVSKNIRETWTRWSWKKHNLEHQRKKIGFSYLGNWPMIHKKTKHSPSTKTPFPIRSECPIPPGSNASSSGKCSKYLTKNLPNVMGIERVNPPMPPPRSK